MYLKVFKTVKEDVMGAKKKQPGIRPLDYYWYLLDFILTTPCPLLLLYE